MLPGGGPFDPAAFRLPRTVHGRLSDLCHKPWNWFLDQSQESLVARPRNQINAVKSKAWRHFAFPVRVAKERKANPKHVKDLRALPAIPCDTDATRKCSMFAECSLRSRGSQTEESPSRSGLSTAAMVLVTIVPNTMSG